MDDSPLTPARSFLGTVISAAIVLGACAAVGLVAHRNALYPRTDDAEVVANFIGMAPLVEGPVVELLVHDNDFVKKGQLLYRLDDRPYLYALQRALAAQAGLEGEIRNESRRIASQESGVSVAEAGFQNARANQDRAEAEMKAAQAAIAQANASLGERKMELAYADHNLHRIEPLLARQFVTPDDVDRARTLAGAKSEAVRRAESELALANARLTATVAQKAQAAALIAHSDAQIRQSSNAVLTIDPLIAERENRAAAVRRARYDYEQCSVYAPFDARVTNLTISEGQYVKTGQQLFTLIDARNWWVMANFRETQLDSVRPGQPADIYLMSKPGERLDGVVESIGYGVAPDPDVVGKFTPSGLPETQRTLNWVRLASRYPVRIRITAPPPDLLRVSQVAVVTMRPRPVH